MDGKKRLLAFFPESVSREQAFEMRASTAGASFRGMIWKTGI